MDLHIHITYMSHIRNKRITTSYPSKKTFYSFLRHRNIYIIHREEKRNRNEKINYNIDGLCSGYIDITHYSIENNIYNALLIIVYFGRTDVRVS